MAARDVVRVYRKLLRAVDARVTASTGDTLWRDYIRSEFRGAAPSQDAIDNKLRAAQDYAFLLNSVGEHEDLVELYQIGMDEEERRTGLIEKTAARVGFSLPPKAPPLPSKGASTLKQAS